MPAPPNPIANCQRGWLRGLQVPLSAIDFHVSDVLADLMGRPEVAAAGRRLTEGSWGPEGDLEACLRKAMWVK